MRQTFKQHVMSLVLAATAAGGCSGGINNSQQGEGPKGGFLNGISPGTQTGQNVLADGNVDYGAALRTASLKLVGTYPTLADIKALQTASDPAKTFSDKLDAYLADPRFAINQKAFWSDTFKMGGQKTVDKATLNLDAVPTFATMLVVKEQPFTKLFTETGNTCLALSADGTTFSAGTCPNQSQPTVGVLTDPGMQAQFFSSLAFRRVRWIQETFMCQAFPAEQNGKPIQKPGGAYQSPWPFESIAGTRADGTTVGRINFLAADSLICANCHSTINHVAPLLGKYDETGALQADFAVHTPVSGTPNSQLTDWLPAGQNFAWRYGQQVTDISSLGQAIASDPGFARCVATRVWNWAFSHGDVVSDQSTLPQDVTGQLAADLKASNYNVKKLIREVFTNPSFVRY